MGRKLQFLPCRAIPSEGLFSPQIRKRICLCSQIPHVKLMLPMELHQNKMNVREEMGSITGTSGVAL